MRAQNPRYLRVPKQLDVNSPSATGSDEHSVQDAVVSLSRHRTAEHVHPSRSNRAASSAVARQTVEDEIITTSIGRPSATEVATAVASGTQGAQGSLWENMHPTLQACEVMNQLDHRSGW